MGLSADVRNYLVRRWYLTELGEPPTGKEQAFHAQVIADKGVDVAYAGIYDSPQAQQHRKKTGRAV